MARFVNSIGAIAGKVGNLVFTRNRYGEVLRRRAVPVNVRTAAQRFSRGQFSAAASYWRQTIAPANCDIAWNAFAANFPLHQGKGTKQAVVVTGEAFSVAINALRARLGLPMQMSPPNTWGTDQPSAVTASGVGGTSVTVSAISGITMNATDYLIVKATGPLSAGVRFIGKSKYRMIYGALNPALPLAVTAEYQAVFGGIPPKGAMIGVSIQVVKCYTTLGPPVSIDTCCPGQPVFVRVILS